MKKTLNVLSLSVLSAAAVSAGENLVKNGDFSQGGINWSTTAIFNKVDQTFTLSPSRHTMISKEIIPIDTQSTYKMTVKLSGANYSALFCGLIPVDKNGNIIYTRNSSVVRGSDSVLLQDVSAGSDTIMVKKAPNWKLHRYANVAFNTKPDLSDLPNFDVAAVKSVTGKADGVEVKFSKPLEKSYAAGTGVRMHTDGATYIYLIRFPKDISQGVELSDNIGPRTRDRFRAGTVGVKVYLFMSAPRSSKDAKLVVEEIRFEKIAPAAK